MKFKKNFRTSLILHKFTIVLLVGCVLLGGLLTYSAMVISKDDSIVELTRQESPTGRISFASWGSPSQMEISKMVAQQFYSQYNIQVDVFCFPDVQSFRSKVISQFASGDPYDVFYADDFTFHTLVKKDWLINLTDLQTDKKINSNDYYEKAFNIGKLNGNLYGIPAGINPNLIYYNINLLKAAGIEDLNKIIKEGKWNLDYFIKVCKQLKQRKKVYGMAVKNDWSTIFSIIYNNGGNINKFLEDGSIIADKKAQDTVNSFKDLISNNYCICMGNMPKGVTEDELFKSEKVAMIYAGYDYLFLFKDIQDFQWDIIPFPSIGKGSGASANNVIVISAAKNTKQAKAAKDFILFYTSVQGQKLRLEKGEKNMSSLKYAVYLNTEDMTLPEHSNYIFYSLSEGFFEPNVMNYIQNKDKLFDKFNQVWTGKMDLDKVLKVK
jgi:multiple sugar transport system substrate-binding protein